MLLTQTWPCQDPQSLSPMEMTNLCLSEAQRHSKASLWSVCSCGQHVQRMSAIASSLQMFMAQRPSGTAPTEISQTSLFDSSVSYKPCLLDSAVCITLLFCSSVYSTYAELLGERDCDFSIRDLSPPNPSFSLSVCLLVIVLPPQSGQFLDPCWTQRSTFV